MSLFMAGLAGSVTHCSGMCGPFVMAMAGDNRESPRTLRRLSGALLLPYHAGRIVTYALLGMLAALFAGQVAQVPGLHFIPALLLVMGGVFFFLQFLGVTDLSLPLPSLPAALQKQVTALSQKPEGLNGFLMGLILGFLPCGMLFSALLVAASAPQPWEAGLGMALFGLATMPVLQAIAFLKNHLAQHRPHWLHGIRKGLTLSSSLTLFFLAGVRLT